MGLCPKEKLLLLSLGGDWGYRVGKRGLGVVWMMMSGGRSGHVSILISTLILCLLGRGSVRARAREMVRAREGALWVKEKGRTSSDTGGGAGVLLSSLVCCCRLKLRPEFDSRHSVQNGGSSPRLQRPPLRRELLREGKDGLFVEHYSL